MTNINFLFLYEDFPLAQIILHVYNARAPVLMIDAFLAKTKLPRESPNATKCIKTINNSCLLAPARLRAILSGRLSACDVGGMVVL